MKKNIIREFTREQWNSLIRETHKRLYPFSILNGSPLPNAGAMAIIVNTFLEVLQETDTPRKENHEQA